jgi:[ribosomal protein S18]-alanine N-acetyltransferase
MSWLVSPAASPDVPALVALAAECGLEVDFPAELARTYARLLVVRHEDVVCGFVLAWRAADELHLTDLGVTAQYRRRGVARALVLELLRDDARVVFLEVRASNAAALALYGSLGFTELDRRARYYSDNGEDAVVMQRLLR